MSDSTYNNIDRVTNLLDTVIESLSNISKERNEHKNDISNLKEQIESNTVDINEKINNLDNSYKSINTIITSTIDNNINVLKSDNLILHTTLVNKIAELEKYIQKMEENNKMLQAKYDENIANINNKLSRKWWKLCQ